MENKIREVGWVQYHSPTALLVVWKITFFEWSPPSDICLTYFLTFYLAFYLVYLQKFFVFEVRRGTLWSGGPEEGGPADIKSNNPHLTGGEKTLPWLNQWFFLDIRPIHWSCQMRSSCSKFPLVGWWKKRGLKVYPWKTTDSMMIDGMITSSRPQAKFLPHMDITDHGGNPHQLVDITPMNTIVYLHISYIYHISTMRSS